MMMVRTVTMSAFPVLEHSGARTGAEHDTPASAGDNLTPTPTGLQTELESVLGLVGGLTSGSWSSWALRKEVVGSAGPTPVLPAKLALEAEGEPRPR